MREVKNTTILIIVTMLICLAILFGEQIMEAVNMAMMGQADSLVDQLLR